MHLHRAGAAGLALGLALVVGVAAAAPANAFILPPEPVSFPGSAVPAGNTMTPAQWNTYLAQHPELVPSKATTGAAALKMGVTGVAGAATAFTGFQIGTSLGSPVASMLGLPTSGDFMCDVAQLTSGSACGALGPSPSYVPNSDVVLTTPGWTDNPEVVTVSGTAPYTHRVLHTISPVPAFNQVGGTVTIVAQITGWPNCAGNPGGRAYLRVYRKATPTGSASANGGTYVIPGTSGCTSNGATLTQPINVGAGQYFDHVQISTDGTFEPGTTRDWYPVGHASRPADTNPNPARAWRSTWTCTSGPGGTATSASFFEGDPTWPAVPQPTPCASGQVASLTVEQMTNGFGSTVYQWTLPAEVGAAASAYPECAAGACLLDLSRTAAPGSTDTVSCFSSPELCTEWWTETAAGTQATEDSEYRCRYGTNDLPLVNCAVYSQAFKSGVYADPLTGAAPAVSTPAPEPDNGCPPPFTFTSLVTPWWYFKGVTCALEWAFVPQPSSVNLTRIRTAVDTSPPAVWSGAVSGMFDGLSITEGGCAGPPLRWNAFGMDKTFYPFSACVEPMSNIAPKVKIIAGALLVVFGSMACVRALGSGFGWKPSAGGDS